MGRSLSCQFFQSNLRTFLRYESVIALDKEEGCDTEDMSLDSPPYIVIAKTAQLWLAGSLKQGRDPNKAGDLYNDAAEVAMNCMKGKMANKYYMLAEEAYGEGEDEQNSCNFGSLLHFYLSLKSFHSKGNKLFYFI